MTLMGLSAGEVIPTIRLAVLTKFWQNTGWWQTERQTDRRTDGGRDILRLQYTII